MKLSASIIGKCCVNWQIDCVTGVYGEVCIYRNELLSSHPVVALSDLLGSTRVVSERPVPVDDGLLEERADGSTVVRRNPFVSSEESLFES